MQCSDCRKTVKPVVALDIDGTLGDHHGHFRAFATRYVGREVGPTSSLMWGPDHYPYDVEFSEWLRLDKPLYREVKLAYRQGGMKRLMPSFSGAEWLVDRLRAQGCEVWLCTTRPYLRLDNIDPDTREWCRRNRIHYDGLIYGEDKYHQLADRVGVDRVVGVLDDLPEMFDAADELGLPVIQKQNAHRGEALREPFAPTLAEAAELVHKNLQDWRNRQEEKVR